MKIKCHDTKQHEVRLVIGKVPYTFQLKDTGSWYGFRPMAEILNAIAKDRGCSKRFFAYETYWGNYVGVTVFMDPAIAEELKETFGVKPFAEFEKYFPTAQATTAGQN